MPGDGPKLREEHNEDAEQDSSSDDELSLEQLSQAYAQVLQMQNKYDDSPSEQEEDGSVVADDPDPADDVDPDELSSVAGERREKRKTLEQMDAADNAACPISPKSIIEAMLFVGAPADVKLTGKMMAAVMRDVSPKEVKKTIKELNIEYEKSDAAFRIVEESGNYKLQLRDDLAEVRNFFFGRNKAARLSQSAIDVLAIVAYNQPVAGSQVDKIRARPSGGVLSQLLRRNLVNVDTSSKPAAKIYQTTDRFLELFGLESLKDLPQTSVVSDLEELADF